MNNVGAATEQRLVAPAPLGLEKARGILTQQIDLEISLARRRSEAADARVEWGHYMRQGLVDSLQKSNDEAEGSEFENESRQILRAINLKDPVWKGIDDERGLRLKSSPRRRSSHQQVHQELITQPSASMITPSKRPLFIHQRLESNGPFVTLLLACEICCRSEFNSLHGILSHVRSHGLHYRNHDECIDRCGRVVTGSEALVLRREGNEVAGSMVPGLKQVFSFATGSSDSKTLSRTIGLHTESPSLAAFLGKPTRKKQINVYEPQEEIDIVGIDEKSCVPLVYEFDLPSIILGKRRRETNGQGSDSHLSQVDLGFLSENYYDGSMGLDVLASEHENSKHASRFHIKRRLALADWSRIIPLRQRTGTDSHKWMLAVTSPSYSPHVTTFVSRISVRCVSEIIPSCFAASATLSTEQPHFSILGTSHIPFLARVTIEWTGGSTKALEIYHWVNLDMSGSTAKRLGEEEILDVELDRNTPMKPAVLGASLSWDVQTPEPKENVVTTEVHDHEGYALERVSPVAAESAAIVLDVTPSSEAQMSMEMIPSVAGVALRELSPPSKQRLEPYETVLIALLSRIPLTMDDESFKEGLVTPHIQLPQNRQSFLSLTDGRRKAAEWRHARILLESFQSYAQGDPVLLQDQEAIASITAGALYRWMLDRNVFPRDNDQSAPPVLSYDMPGEVGSRPTPEVYCSFCGLDNLQHPNIKSKPPGNNIETAVTICSEAYSPLQRLQIPLVDIKLWMASRERMPAQMKELSGRHSKATLAASSADYVVIAHPRVLEYFNSDAFRRRLRGRWLAPMLEPGTILPARRHSLEDVNDSIAPIALLAIIFRLFVQDLVRNGICVARAIGARVQSSGGGPTQTSAGILPISGSKDVTQPRTQVLTPSHVLSVLRGEFGSSARFGDAVCRLGVGGDGLPLLS